MAILGIVITSALVTRAGLPMYDDALFFRRYAINYLHHGAWAWNVEDGPIHGNTSQLWQAIVLGIAWLAEEWTILVGRLFLGGCLLASGWMFCRAFPNAQRVVVLGLVSPIALATMVSGMETATTIVLGTALLTVPRGAGLFTVLLYLARPDTLLLSGFTLLLRKQWTHMLFAGIGLLTCLTVFYLGYGSALPLSFAMKTGQSGLYDDHFLALSEIAGQRHLLLFLIVTAPFIWLGRAAKALVPALVFIGFHAFGSIDVMGMHGRFYAPCLPWIVAAAAERWSDRNASPLSWWFPWAALVFVAVRYGWIPGESGWAIGQISTWSYAAYVCATGLVFWRGWGLLLVVIGLVISQPKVTTTDLSDDGAVAGLRDMVSSWRGLKKAHTCLGSDLHVYHSEIGVPGHYFSRITDLGGLMNTETHAGTRFEEMCLRDQPDLLFLPHRNYRNLNKEILQGNCIKQYKRVVKRSSSPLYVRKDLLPQYRCKI